jgi:hypothetical protein
MWLILRINTPLLHCFTAICSLLPPVRPQRTLRDATGQGLKQRETLNALIS